jgi:putative membrane protein
MEIIQMNRSWLLACSFLVAGAMAPLAARADSPREFLNDALQGDNSEIMLGNLAADRARNSAVRDFGRTLVSDHTQARNEVLDTGRRFGIRPAHDVTSEARETRDRLMGLRGRAFDREFVRYMVEDHRKDVAAFRDEAREHHGAVSDLAARQLPTLREHLRTAISLDRDNGRFDGRSDQADWRDRDRNADRGNDYNRGGDRGNNSDRYGNNR